MLMSAYSMEPISEGEIDLLATAVQPADIALAATEGTRLIFAFLP